MSSKELLSEVLGVFISSVITDIETVKQITRSNSSDNYIAYTIEDVIGWHTINIHELAHKCKVWANKNNYYVASGKYYENWDCEIFKISWDAKSWHEPEETFDAPTEPEAIFKACQWILDNKES